MNGTKKVKKMLIISFVVIVVIQFYLASSYGVHVANCYKEQEKFGSNTSDFSSNYFFYAEEKYYIWYFEAPFGVWHINGIGESEWSILHGNSNLDIKGTESYIIKYLDMNELKTLIVESTDENVHVLFLDLGEKPYIKIRIYYRGKCTLEGVKWLKEGYERKYEVWIYIPRREAPIGIYWEINI